MNTFTLLFWDNHVCVQISITVLVINVSLIYCSCRILRLIAIMSYSVENNFFSNLHQPADHSKYPNTLSNQQAM